MSLLLMNLCCWTTAKTNDCERTRNGANTSEREREKNEERREEERRGKAGAAKDSLLQSEAGI